MKTIFPQQTIKIIQTRQGNKHNMTHIIIIIIIIIINMTQTYTF